ncbi:glycoside hydrolase family 26 protein [Kitasatospora sp. NPDC052896]|uniref:glycoside hydrolase family 26 protein n=1 Tax=Kitasatospora sp. NPDC052896 TaxID=3364061 RepID=UPI0037C90C6A
MRIGRLALAASALLLLTTAGAAGLSQPTADRVPASSSGPSALSGPSDSSEGATSPDGIAHPRGAAPRPPVRLAPHEAPFGAFVGSWDTYIPQIARLATWLNGANLQVGHTYLAGNTWDDVEGDTKVLALWSQWRVTDPARTLVLNVPMLVPNEANLPDDQVARLLQQGARGDFDQHFLKLGRKLVALGGGDTVIVLGWEMNGLTYTSRCKPDPAAWKAYWRRVVDVLRSVPGQRFRFDFTPSRGLDAIAWTRCYPGDDVVDIIGTDSYDQPAGATFDDYVREPYGLQDQVEFAARRGKQVSYPEWGLFRNGDNPEFVRRMVDWMRTHDTAYQTLTDYCPHGFWECRSNPRSSAVFRALMAGSRGVATASTPPPCPGSSQGLRPVRPDGGAGCAVPRPPAAPSAPPVPGDQTGPTADAVPVRPPRPSRPDQPVGPPDPPAPPAPPELSLGPDGVPLRPDGR